MPLLLTDRAATVSPLQLITASEARMLGLAVTSDRWLRVRRGVYVDREGFGRLPPWQKYIVRVHAFARMHPDSVLCMESAATVLGLPLFGETRDIHVFDPARTSSRRFGDVCVHTSVDPRSVQRIGGLLVTGMRDTVVDLLRVLPPVQALTVADAAMSPAQGGALTRDDLSDHAAVQQSTRGLAQLRWIWSRADPDSESPAESVSRAVIEWSGFETPETQREFRYEGVLDRTDFYFPSSRAIGEADGWSKYRFEDPKEAARLLADEKRREDRLRRHRHPFARWDLRAAWRVEPLCQALAAASVSLVRPSQPAMLATLARRPREKPRRA